MSADLWEGLNPPYSTIVADPPWAYDEGWPMSNGQGQRGNKGRRPLPFTSMSLKDIALLPVRDLAAADSMVFIWTTNRYVYEAYAVCNAWGFASSQLLTWCKPPRGLGPGGAFASTTEFVVYGRRGTPTTGRTDSTWWLWPRRGHSVKPPEFLDVIESISPSPYVELFARAPRLGWDSWGKGYEIGASA